MAVDLSKILLEKYFRLRNRRIQIRLNNKRVLTGILIGFYRENEHEPETAIIKWHFVDGNDVRQQDIDPFGFLIGEIIDHADIVAIRMEEDNSIIEF